ncbi:MAG: dipeptidase, partial [Muribaculaceae bacterium]|nr:dipeptidase [Muribaculaceae bacterium]
GLEDKFTGSREAMEAELLKMYNSGDVTGLEKAVNAEGAAIAKEATDAYRNLAQFLLVRYIDGAKKKLDADGNFARNPHGKPLSPDSPGYPEEFYRQIVKKTGDRYLLK